MDLVEDFLEIGKHLSVKTIRDLVSAVSRRVPHVYLPCLGKLYKAYRVSGV